MSVVIKGGTVVTADQTFKADVLIDGETIAAIGPGLTGDTVIDATGCFVMPGGIDPHTHLEMPFMGTTTTDTSTASPLSRLAEGGRNCRIAFGNVDKFSDTAIDRRERERLIA